MDDRDQIVHNVCDNGILTGALQDFFAAVPGINFFIAVGCIIF
ncbi:MAG: hypothetical protein ACRCZI_07330 [Cetobacterium sp.]